MADKEERSPLKVMLKNVRLSYPALWKPKGFKNGEGEPKYSANFLLDPDTKVGRANIARMEDAIDHAIKNTDWKGKVPKFTEAKLPLREGDSVDSDGYEGMMFVSASNARPPKVVDRDKLDVREGDDEAPYAGCFVDAAVRVWAQNNEYGKRINCSLEAVRFRDDGDSFGAGKFDVDDFDDLDDDDDGDDRASKRSSRGRDKDDEDRGSKRSSRGRDKDDDDDDDRRSSRGRSSRGRDKDDDDDGDDRRSSRSRGRDKDDDDDGEERRSSRSRGRGRDEDDDGEDERRSSRSRGRDKDDDDDKDERRGRRSRNRDEDDDDGKDERRSRRSRNRDDDDDGI